MVFLNRNVTENPKIDCAKKHPDQVLFYCLIEIKTEKKVDQKSKNGILESCFWHWSK